MPMQLTTTAFPAGGEIPSRFTCDGRNVSPPLAWSGTPTAVSSFAVICRDPDAPQRIFYHWAAYDIAASILQLPEGWSLHPGAAKQAVNDFGRAGYGGPCPPRGHGMHHYHFVLYALNVEHLPLTAKAHCQAVERLAGQHALDVAELIGTYGR